MDCRFYFFLRSRSLKVRMVPANKKVIALPRIIGNWLLETPYNIHRNTPDTNNKYMGSDKCLVCPERIVLIACGKKLIVVKKAATLPSRFVRSIAQNFSLYAKFDGNCFKEMNRVSYFLCLIILTFKIIYLSNALF